MFFKKRTSFSICGAITKSLIYIVNCRGKIYDNDSKDLNFYLKTIAAEKNTENTPRHMIIKLLKNKGIEKNPTREKRNITNGE